MSRSITDCVYSHKAIIIISLILVLTDCYCNKVLSLTHSICHFSYGYNDLNCTQFNFHQCSWVECVSWSSNSTSKTCLNYSTILKTNWNECMSRCCASDRLFPY